MADPDSTDAGVVRNTTLALVTQLVTAALTAFLTLYLTRVLGPRRFGEFALAVAVIGVLLVPADLGISPSVGRFIAEHRDDLPAASVLLANALALKLIASFVASAGVFLLAAPLATAYGDPQLTWPFRGVAVALLGQSLMMLYSTALVSTGKISANLRLYTSESVAEVVASVALVALGGGATGAAFGRAAGYAVGAGTAGALALRAFGARAFELRSPSRRAVVQITRYAGVLFIVNGAFTLFSQIDILLIGAYVGHRPGRPFLGPASPFDAAALPRARRLEQRFAAIGASIRARTGRGIVPRRAPLPRDPSGGRGCRRPRVGRSHRAPAGARLRPCCGCAPRARTVHFPPGPRTTRLGRRQLPGRIETTRADRGRRIRARPDPRRDPDPPDRRARRRDRDVGGLRDVRARAPRRLMP